ncbi:FISUMP domain-containing protein [Aquimarina aggregata]|uniref:FISUMP domain-containing protein n=1 Tax=Aquimarina aggregata TaxID=1642818 RepID=UPI0024905D26|nr:FISUMP domain-containing protein [Aquimarina aggregata]
MKKAKDSIVNVLLICIVVFFGSCNDDDSDLFEVEVKVTEITCSTNGAIDLTVTGGSAPYSFLWSTGATQEDLTNIGGLSSRFTVTIADSKGLTKILDINVPRADSRVIIEAEIQKSDVLTDNGVIKLNLSGGVPPYTINWSNSETGDTISALEPGSYTVEVTDTNGCPAKETFYVEGSENFVDSRDNRRYKMIRNGDQIWMYEPLSFDAPGSTFTYDNPGNADIGRLYRWETLMNGETFDVNNPRTIKGLCPEGFHIASMEEWKVFEDFLKTEEDAYGRITWEKYLGPRGYATFILIDFKAGVNWFSDGTVTYATNSSETYLKVGSVGDNSIEYKSTTIEPDSSYWGEFKHFCHCIKNN